MQEGSALAAITSSWSISFQSVHFLLFLPVVAGAYFLFPGRARRGWLLLASYYFYFFAAPEYLPVLILGTLYSYLFGRLIGAAKGPRAKRAALLCGVAGMVLGLAFFKYNAFFQPVFAPLFNAIGIGYNTKYFIAAKVLGISYYTFTAIGYLVDAYRGDVPAEKNLFTHALFLGFFPSVTAGPISRAGDLIPKLTDTSRRFDPSGAADALRLMAVGFFKKMAVADMLAVFVNAVYNDLPGKTGLVLVAATFTYALQLYFDFSGYTDIARGTAALLGIRLPENFQNPYFSTNFSSFWARWHMSLSTWLQDYIFTPLVWSRWTEKLPLIGKRLTKPPVLSSLAIVFLISGVWHGDTLCFLLWGGLQAVYRIGEELLHRFVGKPKKRTPLASRIGKTAVVLVLWTLSLVFFRIGAGGGSVTEALGVLGNMVSGFSPAAVWVTLKNAFGDAFLGNGMLGLLMLAFAVVCTLFAVWADWYQCFKLKGQSLVLGMQRLPTAVKWLLYYFLVLACFGAFLTGGESFLYGGF